MIHWAWLILAFFVFGFMGFMVAALCAASGWASREEELHKEMEGD